MYTARGFRNIFIITVILLSYSMLSAQIKIKERVEIKPLPKILADAGTGGGLDTIIVDIQTYPGTSVLKEYYVTVYLHRSSIITVKCGLQCDYNPSPVGLTINDVSIANKTIEINSYCGCEGADQSFSIFLWNWTASPMKITGASADAMHGIINIEGYVEYPAYNAEFTVNIELLPTPYNEPMYEEINHYTFTGILDATGKNEVMSSHIAARTISDKGGSFLLCSFTAPATFTIENPMEGVELAGRLEDWTIIRDEKTLDVMPNNCEGWTSVNLEWDGKRLPDVEDTTITVSVSRFGFLTDTCKVKLIKIFPDHFDIEPSSTMVTAGDTISIKAIAKTAEGQEETKLNGQTEVTFYAEDGGSFIIGSEVYEDSVTVTYDEARSGAIKYLDYYGILWTGTEPIDARLEIWRKDFPVLRGDTTISTFPLCEVLEISPEEIGPGDTAHISMMMKKPDGTLAAYEPDQLFDIWMDMNEEYGKLRCISSEDEGTYLTGQQPFEFIAADSLSSDSSVVVRIEAWTSYGGGGASSIAKSDTLYKPAEIMLKKQKSDISKKTALIEKNKLRSLERLKKRLMAQGEKSGNKHRYAVIIESINKRYTEITGITKSVEVEQEKSGQVLMDMQEGASCELPVVQVTIKKEEPCADAPQCSALFEQSPAIWVSPQPNGFNNRDICPSSDTGALAGFQNLVGSFTPIIVAPCYNMQSEEWRFPIMNVIEINVIMDICRDNIINQRKQKLIKSVDEVVPADSSLALQDFKDHYPVHIYPFGPSRQGGYVLEEVLWAHENTHKYHYEVMIAQSRDSLFDKPYQELRFPCEAIKDIDKAKERMEKRLNELLIRLIANVNRQWQNLFINRQAYEKRTHSSVKPLVDNYIRELQNKYNVK